MRNMENIKRVTKSDIVDSVANNSRISKKQIKETMDLILSHTRLMLARHGNVQLRGFGTFSTRLRRARDNARNPKTGEIISISPRRVAFFRPGKELRRLLIASTLVDRE